MAKIKSNLNPEFTWEINIKENPLTAEEIGFIKTFNPSVFSNDQTGTLWAFDTKMPSGRWLENIIFSGDLTKATAAIC